MASGVAQMLTKTPNSNNGNDRQDKQSSTSFSNILTWWHKVELWHCVMGASDADLSFYLKAFVHTMPKAKQRKNRLSVETGL
ncbi:hypothetical protein [Rodentibacter caecimuris]|uniref:hypothetical protein n=1 Tax=Rodentibacter caecimuris TaxID=1796644 RepID=UPI000ACC8907